MLSTTAYYPDVSISSAHKRRAVDGEKVHARFVEFVVTGESNDDIPLHEIFETNNTFKDINSSRSGPVPGATGPRRGALLVRYLWRRGVLLRRFPIRLFVVFFAGPYSVREGLY